MHSELNLFKAERDVEDASLHVRNIKHNMDQIEKEIDTLSTIQIQLLENIRCLKKSRVIALAHEYKKCKQDLEKTDNRLQMLRNDREQLRISYSRAQIALEKCILTRNMWFERRLVSNVIQLDFNAKK